MTLKIYGVAQSRAARALWMAHELGVPFEHVPQKFTGDRAEYLKVNPNGRVPAIVDVDGTTLFESMAINLYLAKKYGRDGIAPRDVVEDGQATQWSFWVMTEVEKTALELLVATLGLMGNPQDPAKAKQAFGALTKPFGVLDAHLAGREYLVGNRFTVADLNVASVLGWVTAARVDLSAWPNMSAWLSRCLARPAYRKARGG
jgi:glutathione S-transferase